ncbi:hypothetical protein ASE01_10465 [Nocardioides sp. Root190]|uniref:CHAD domain-containing protein n=1 Tax=Nocardioides sp. Root190 TaxID=1736488 RepID=UPI0006FDF7AA|nr:CHAD domain-containing protein [Nocardioides sp. Root190]KRB77161.1 hypothetical protein ASE01_10465 [Nocardioides sp. Root190]
MTLAADDLLASALADLVADMLERRPAALADEPDAVHQLRTTIRRTRNLLAAFRGCFEPTAAGELGAALAAHGSVLGECRDLEVRASDAASALQTLGLADELDRAVVAPLRSGHAVAHAVLVAWHRGAGLAHLDAQLTRWSSAPPLSATAARPAELVAPRAVRRQVRRVLRRADEVTTGSPSEEQLHELRKAARRLRHTVDVAGPAGIDGAVAVGRLGQDVQGMLGDQRDALLLARHVRACSRGAADRASYDRLAEHAEDLADGALAGLDEALEALRARASF